MKSLYNLILCIAILGCEEQSNNSVLILDAEMINGAGSSTEAGAMVTVMMNAGEMAVAGSVSAGSS